MPKRERQTPSYKGLKASSELASRIKAKNKAANTKCEILLRSALWRRGLRFRKNVRELPGKPDVVFPRERVVVFVDGDFWHGRNWEERRRKLAAGVNSGYWVAKIQTNMDRDARHNEELTQLGWTVLRFWETDVLTDLTGTAISVNEVVQAKRSGMAAE
jgi:DNA mismatch endonuclease, patch repair protein